MQQKLLSFISLFVFNCCFISAIIACPIQADFSTTTNHARPGDALLFTNLSQNASSYQWFVNGVPMSTATAYTHVFATAGTYVVRLEASNGACSPNIEANEMTITISTNGLLQAGLPVYAMAVSGNVNAQTVNWQTAAPTAGQVAGTTVNGGQTGSAFDQCGNLAFYALHTGSGNPNNLFIYAPDGTELLSNATANSPGLNAIKGGQELQVVKVPQTLDEWYIIYKQWTTDVGAPISNGAYTPANWLYARVQYSTVTGVFTVLQRDVALADGGGTTHTYVDGAAVSRTANGNIDQHYLYLCRRTANVSVISLDRFLIDNGGITFSANTGNLTNTWWNLGAAGSPIELSPTEDRIAVVSRNQNDNTVDLTIFDANNFNTASAQSVILGDLILEADGGVGDLSNVLNTPTEIDVLGTSGTYPLQFLRNYERKASQIEFSPSGQYLYVLNGGYGSGGFTNITYLSQINLDASPMTVRMQVQTTPTAPNMTTGLGCTFASCSANWAAIGTIESSFDGNLYFTKRNSNNLFVIPNPNEPLPQNLVPSDIDLATPDEPNIPLLNGIPRALPDQIDGFNYLDTRYAEVSFVVDRRACDQSCDAPYTVNVVDTSTMTIVQSFIITTCPDTITFCADTTLTYNLVEPVSGITYLAAIDTAEIYYPDFDRDTLFNFSDITPCPEICNNGIDDDGDGLVDCFDDECCGDASCDDNFFICTTPACQSVPNTTQPLDVVELWRQDNTSINVATIPIVGDFDNDGATEIAAIRNTGSDVIVAYDGATGTLENTFNVVNNQGSAFAQHPGGNISTANVDADPNAEFFLVDFNRALASYDYSGALEWQTANGVACGPEDGIALADFNQDGIAEYYSGNLIGNAQTGDIYINADCSSPVGRVPCGGCLSGGVWSPAYPVAVDVLDDASCLDCKGLELVAGNVVYSVNIDPSNPANNRISIERTLAGGFGDGLVSIADMDGDGDLDAVISGAINANYGVYIWDLQTPTLMQSIINPVSAANWGGRVTLANFDADNALEMGWVTNNRIFFFDTDFTVLNSLAISDPSMSTGLVAFDFQGDGVDEILYRGESDFVIYEGITGNVLATLPGCVSPTANEYPVIADVNNDGQTEIVVLCGSATTNYISGVSLRVLGSASGTWVSSRPVWNQHTYYNVNINDDLTVPAVQQQHHIVGDSSIMNSFMLQYRDPQFAAPDATVSVLSANNDVLDSITVQVQVCNIGDQTLSANTPIAFYNEDPTSSAGATLMLGIQTLGTNIEVGNCELITYRVQGASGDVYAVVNCDNSVPPVFDFNTDFPMTAIGECDYTNNMDSRPVVVLLGESDLVFDAKKVEETVHLYWSFGANNADAYQSITIERSRNGIDFYPIQTELDPKDLRFIDEDPKQGINYYRLKVYEKSGTFYYTHIEAFKFDGLSPINVQVFPNPFDQNIQLRFGDLPLSGKLSLSLINQLGQTVAEDQVVADNLTLTWKPQMQLSTGSYWLKIVFDDQVMYKKVIKK